MGCRWASQFGTVAEVDHRLASQFRTGAKVDCRLSSQFDTVAKVDCRLASQLISHDGWLLVIVYCEASELVDDGRKNCYHWG